MNLIFCLVAEDKTLVTLTVCIDIFLVSFLQTEDGAKRALAFDRAAM